MRFYHWWIIIMLGTVCGVQSQICLQNNCLLTKKDLSFRPSLLAKADSMQDETPMIRGRHVSRGKVFLLSFLMPGAGEYYLGDRKMAALFFGTELALWSSYFILNWYSDLKADDYTLYAIAHAGVNPRGKDHQFYVDIEAYENLIAYNDAMLQERRPQDMYPENGLYDWSWDSKASMHRFERMRLNSDRFKNAGVFMIGGVILNHLVSGIDAMRIARKSSESVQSRMHVHFAGLPEGGMQVTFWKSF
ncbi:hypothetical protein JW835_05520 [bacterium]|nr:hypothetical protein [bacterium]